MKKMLKFAFGLLIGFVAAYAFDYWLTRRDQK
jgi:hypothetical protein